MERRVVIIGAGSVGLHIAANAELYGLKDTIMGFLDDDTTKIGKSFYGIPVLDTVSWIGEQGELDVVVGIAFPAAKQRIVASIIHHEQLSFPTLIARQNVWISNDCTIGKGTVVYPGCSVNYASVIGDFVVMNMNCALGHHASIGNYTSLAPGVNLGGHTTVEEMVDLGIGTCTVQNVHIGQGAVIGGQAMLIHHVPPGSTAKGVPAKINSNE
jgi:sugar O-acyltransferase (sialic acid O-acetyltransferase NeuD family)